MEELDVVLAHAQSGDLQAYSAIVSRFRLMAYSYAYAILQDLQLAADATRMAFIKAYARLTFLGDSGEFYGWFKQIVTECCDDLSPRARMLRVIDGLPIEERIVTTLSFVTGNRRDEIARFLQMSLSTVDELFCAAQERLETVMLEMVQSALKDNALPADFARRTTEQAVAGHGH